MENFKIDPLSVIGDPEKIRMVSVGADEPAGKSLLNHPGCGFSVLLEIKPEESFSESYVKKVDLGKQDIECLLKKSSVYLFIQDQRYPVCTGHVLPCDGGEKIARIIQSVPSDVLSVQNFILPR